MRRESRAALGGLESSLVPYKSPPLFSIELLPHDVLLMFGGMAACVSCVTLFGTTSTT